MSNDPKSQIPAQGIAAREQHLTDADLDDLWKLEDYILRGVIDDLRLCRQQLAAVTGERDEARNRPCLEREWIRENVSQAVVALGGAELRDYLLTDPNLPSLIYSLAQKREEQATAALASERDSLRAAAMQWISVKDQLPSDDKMVIVPGGVGTYYRGYWYSNTGPSSGRRISWTVTHWQSMPEPPADRKGEV